MDLCIKREDLGGRQQEVIIRFENAIDHLISHITFA